ncbi:MAG: prepilin-type N-terminal cleavage/methylation domain-containing protein [Achromobacter sp.]|uniref:type 4 pilus major pilin n=1 Tax=Achromobacter sp. TaxID=134375 RepID=UPI0012C9F08C|nr:type 4 pilus major pilin [Achromobacter sp.]MPS81706.1 prepilin-type N-terminal cleavage/methylation domain-containing protein [Achromobacter sp.]
MQAELITQANWNALKSARKRHATASGFTMTEIAIALAVIAILTIFSIPRVEAYIIDGKVPKVAEDLRRFMTRNRINGSSAADPNTAFAGATQRSFALALSGSTTMASNTTTYQVQHNLGSGGVVRYAGVDGGKGYSLSLDKVHQIACANLAGILARDSNKISINGQEQKNTETPVNFNPTTADAACVDGENNTVVFTVGNYEINAGSR